MKIHTLPFHIAWARLGAATVRLLLALVLLAGLGLGAAHAATVQKVAAGANHTLAIRPDGTLWSWGYNESGQLGNGTNLVSASPVKVGSGFAQVAAAGNYSLAIKTDGSLWAWGDNLAGQLGNGTTTNANRPVQIGTGYVQVVAHDLNAAAIKADGSLMAWGNNEYGTLGQPTSTLGALFPTLVGVGFSQVSTLATNSLAVKTDGSLWVWGVRERYWLYPSGSHVPQSIGSGFVQAAIGESNVALKTDGSLWIWGEVCTLAQPCPKNWQGDVRQSIPVPTQVGTGYRDVYASGKDVFLTRTDGTLLGPVRYDFSKPLPEFGSGFSSAATSERHGVAVKSDGSVWTFGNNDFGQLGVGSMPNAYVPVLVGADFAQVSAGGSHSVGIRRDGTLWTWGEGTGGALGNGSFANSSSPVLVGAGFSKAVAGDRDVYAIKTDSSLWAWGSNYYDFFNAPLSAERRVNAPFQFDTGYAEVSVAYDRAFGIKTDGSLWAWGKNDKQQLGDGTTTDAIRPVKIGDCCFVKVAASNAGAVALKADGTLWAWGYALSENTVAYRVPLPVQFGSGFAHVAAAADHLYAVTSDGDFWKFNIEWLSTTKINFVAPGGSFGPIYLGSGFALPVGGFSGGLAIQTDGRLWSTPYWSSLSAFLPVASGNEKLPNFWVLVGRDYTQAATGNNHFLGLKSDGSLYGWGRNELGQLGIAPGPVSLPLTQVVFPSVTPQQSVNGKITSEGPAFNVLLSATLTPDPIHTQSNTPGHMFFVAILPDGRVFTHTLNGWLPLDNVKREGYGAGLRDTRVDLLIGVNTAELKGTHIYLGYGLGSTATQSWDEMLTSGRFKLGTTL